MEEFQHAVKTCFNKYADFSGRADRPEFWWFFVFQLAVYVVARFVHGFVEFIAVLALLVPALAVAARRLHDTGKSGWFLLLGLIPVVGGLVVLFFAAQPGQPQDNEYGPVTSTGTTPALAPGQQ